MPVKPGKSWMMVLDRAIECPWIQVNKESEIEWLVVDIDEPNAATLWQDEIAPTPNLVVINTDNGHAQYFYRLASPVYAWKRQRKNPAYRYLEAIYDGLNVLLKGDFACSLHSLKKNPCHSRWRVCELHKSAFELSVLAEYVELRPKYKRTNSVLCGGEYGRNCTLFHSLRLWAYKNTHVAGSYSDSAWFQFVYEEAIERNSFSHPLLLSEVRSISRSVADFVKYRYEYGSVRTYRDLDKHSPNMTVKDKQSQAARETNASRIAKTELKIRTVVENFKLTGREITISAISCASGVHRNSVSKYKHILYA